MVSHQGGIAYCRMPTIPLPRDKSYQVRGWPRSRPRPALGKLAQTEEPDASLDLRSGKHGLLHVDRFTAALGFVDRLDDGQRVKRVFTTDHRVSLLANQDRFC